MLRYLLSQLSLFRYIDYSLTEKVSERTNPERSRDQLTERSSDQLTERSSGPSRTESATLSNQKLHRRNFVDIKEERH